MSDTLPPEKQGVLTRNVGRFDSYGGVTATLKPAIELRPWAEDRAVGVEIDDDVRDALVVGDTLAGGSF